MPEIVLPCSCCGDLIIYTGEQVVRQCAACGTANARPVAAEASADILRHAVRQRLGCDFANAERSYQHVLLEHPDESEALWGRLLCHYGVEYVKDPATGRLTPTVHTVRRKPLRLQPEFRDACAFAPDEVRARYEQEAAYIDDAQATIRMAAASCPPYDVFLCHKTTHPGTGEKTEDFHRATQLYYYLREQGLHPFFAPESLMGLAGADYEAGVYHAIDTAKVMLVLCSDKEWLTSAWVRSEWSRFIERIDDGADKRIVPLLYDRFDPALLPPEFRFRRIQGFPMGELTSTERLMALVREAVGKEAPAVAVPVSAAEKTVPDQEETAPAPKPAPRRARKSAPAAEKTVPEQEEAATPPKPAPRRARKSASAAEKTVPEQEETASTLKPALRRARKSATTAEKAASVRGSKGKENSGQRAAGAAVLPAPSNVLVGASVYFGSYPQEEKWKTKPIEWIVLRCERNRALLLSRYGLARRRYDRPGGKSTWAECELRKWLNGEFLSEAFSELERSLIVTAAVPPARNISYDTDPGKATRDKVFVLGAEEADTYLKTMSAKRCFASQCVIPPSWFDATSHQSDIWWLRSPGGIQGHVMCVNRDGIIMEYGKEGDAWQLVRPALWITLEE